MRFSSPEVILMIPLSRGNLGHATNPVVLSCEFYSHTHLEYCIFISIPYRGSSPNTNLPFFFIFLAGFTIKVSLSVDLWSFCKIQCNWHLHPGQWTIVEKLMEKQMFRCPVRAWCSSCISFLRKCLVNEFILLCLDPVVCMILPQGMAPISFLKFSTQN